MSDWLSPTSAGAQRETKKYLRRHLKDAFVRQRDHDAKAWLDVWFSAETQNIFQEFMKKLKK